jgi:hypothetical protein
MGSWQRRSSRGKRASPCKTSGHGRQKKLGKRFLLSRKEEWRTIGFGVEGVGFGVEGAGFGVEGVGFGGRRNEEKRDEKEERGTKGLHPSKLLDLDPFDSRGVFASAAAGHGHPSQSPLPATAVSN